MAIDIEPHLTPQALGFRSRNEERINTVTHGIGLLLSVIGVAHLLLTVGRQGDAWQRLGCSIYGASLIAVYAASTLSHFFLQPRLRRLFRIIDQAFIFLLIAGTFTPIALTYLRFGHWWWLLGGVWAVALAGFSSKAIFTHQIEGVSTVLHVALGWLPAVSIRTMWEVAPHAVLGWFLAGGVLYTAGTIFLHRDARVPYFHAVWHLCVIGGSVCHYLPILFYCTTAVA